MNLIASPVCVGINAAVPASLATTNIEGHEMVEIPGGATVVGSHDLKYDKPRWIWLSPYRMARTPTSRFQYREVMGRPGRIAALEDHPITHVSYREVMEYLKERGGGLDLPTRAQLENAARGWAMDVRKEIEAIAEKPLKRLSLEEFLLIADPRWENFVTGVLAPPLSSTDAYELLVKEQVHEYDIYAWRKFATPSGRLSAEDVLFKWNGTAPADWGPAGPWGLYNMAGNVWEWAKDRYDPDTYPLLSGVDPAGPSWGDFRVIYGGSWYTDNIKYLRAAKCHFAAPNDVSEDVGFRVAAPASAVK